jgi:N-ethylmaleimide reductase
LKHPVVMAPLTHLRSEQPGDVPSELMAQYYARSTSFILDYINLAVRK